MLEGYVGQSAFREGVRRYLSSHAYANTVDADFWREIQNVNGLSLLQIEADFTRQPGVPLLTVESEQTNDKLSKLVVSQGRFFEDPSTPAPPRPETWHIPVAITTGTVRSTHLISGSAPAMLAFDRPGPVIVNAGQTAFARTLYPQSVFKQLIAELSALKPKDQLGLLYDAWALGQSGYAPVTNYLDLTRALPIEADPIVWGQVIETLVSIDRLYKDKPGQGAFRAFARDRLKPFASRLGWEPSPGEEQNAAILRGAVLGALSRFGDQSVLDESQRRFSVFMKNSNEISPAVRQIVLSVAARHADAQTLDRLITLLRATHNSLEKERICIALAGIGDPIGAQRVLDLSVAPDLPAGMFLNMVWFVSKDHPDLSWKFSVDHVDQPGSSMDSMVRLFFMPAIASNSSDVERIRDLQAYADAHIPPSARQHVQDAIGTIKLNSKFRQSRLPEIDRWLKAQIVH
jgi:aminopeptidase N